MDYAMHNADNCEATSGEARLKTIGNHVYFYDSVTGESALALTAALVDLDNKTAQRSVMDGCTPDLWLHINSPGGSLTDAFAIVDAIRTLRAPVNSVIWGMAASAATLISCACKRRFVSRHALLLVHQFTAFRYGTYQQNKDDSKADDILMELMLKFYAERTGLSKKRVRKIVARESWMGAAEAVELGFADMVMT